MIRAADDEVELLRVDGAINAEPILAALRANGIPARSAGEALGSVYGLTLDGLGEVVIFVPAEFEELLDDDVRTSAAGAPKKKATGGPAKRAERPRAERPRPVRSRTTPR